MRLKLFYAGTLASLASPVVAPDPGPTPEDAVIQFDPSADRSQVDATTDEFRLVVAPSTFGPSRPPSFVRVSAFAAGTVPAGATTDEIAGLSPIASVELPVPSYGKLVGRLEGLPAAAPYDAVIIAGYPD